MISRPHVWLIVGIVILVVAGGLYVQGEEISQRQFTSMGIAVGSVITAITVFDRWIWRLGILQGWLVHRPHLMGEWTVTVRPLPPDKPANAVINGTLSIRQTYLGVHARLETRESQGNLVCGQILREPDGRYRLAGVYRNEPKHEFRDGSPIHYGTFLLDVDGPPNRPTRLRGSYWTDRQTKGDLEAAPATSA